MIIFSPCLRQSVYPVPAASYPVVPSLSEDREAALILRIPYESNIFS